MQVGQTDDDHISLSLSRFFLDHLFFFFLFSVLSTCLQPLHCPTNVKSFGGLIVNLLRLLGIHNCDTDDRNLSCPHEKRLIILHELFTYATKINDESYCKLV